MASVTISREFFSNIRRDYTSWTRAFIREALQNCQDAPNSTKIDVTFTNEDLPIITFANNGEPMTKEVLVGKLLSLGGSGKAGQAGAVGGFGVAKSLLYMGNVSYVIRTGQYLVAGSGGQYDLTETDHHAGTMSAVTFDKSDFEYVDVKSLIGEYVSLADWNGEITFNGEPLKCDVKPGTFHRNLGDWGAIHTTDAVPDWKRKCVVRIKGIPMFTVDTNHDETLVIELLKPSVDLLASNRDSLKYPYYNDFGKFVNMYNSDRAKALSNFKTEITHFAGEKLRNAGKVAPATAAFVSNVNVVPAMTKEEVIELVKTAIAKAKELEAEAVADPADGDVEVMADQAALDDQSAKAVTVMMDKHGVSREVAVAAVTRVVKEKPRISGIVTDFVIRNDWTDFEIPAKFQPDSEKFTGYARNLATIWGRLMLTLYDLHGIAGSFSIGFTFDDLTIAGHCDEAAFGKVYYVSPVTDRKGTHRFKLYNRAELIAAASHEFCHGAYNLPWHTESFASRLTCVMAVVLANRAKFDWCFR